MEFTFPVASIIFADSDHALPIWSERVTNCESAARQFVDELYYPSYDNKGGHSRRQVNKLYSPQATLVWRGRHFKGGEQIQRFIEDLPETEHRIESYDAQPLAGAEGEKAVDLDSAPLSCQLTVTGSVQYRNVAMNEQDAKQQRERFEQQGHRGEFRPRAILNFSQHFVLVAMKNETGKASWKIVSEIMRLHDR